MAIDMEPKNGDFARYIENLSRAGGATSGRVSRGEATRPASAPVPSATSEPLSTAPWGKASPSLQPIPGGTLPAPGIPGQEDAGTVSMAKRARQRKIGIVLTIGGILAGWAAARIAFDALRRPEFELDALMPAIFLAFFAFMLFKAAASARNARKTRLETLPPLRPSSHRKDAG